MCINSNVLRSLENEHANLLTFVQYVPIDLDKCLGNLRFYNESMNVSEPSSHNELSILLISNHRRPRPIHLIHTKVLRATFPHPRRPLIR